jgi:hypothetical protein
VQACCVSPVQLGSLRQSSVADIWDGEALRQFRVAHLSGRRVAGCERCYAAEALGGPSMRRDAAKEFGSRAADRVRRTTRDGHVPDSHPIDFDIRFSNICNLKCRTCYHGSSSRWYADYKAVYGRQRMPGVLYSDRPVIRAFENPRDSSAAFGACLDHMEKLVFAGGEPLLQEEHYQLLRRLRDRRRLDVSMHYVTNLSVLCHRGLDVTHLWRDFRHVHLTASLDDSGSRGELLRYGQSWPKVLENRERLRRVCPHLTFRVTCTVSALNALRVSAFHRELIDTGFIAPHEFAINIACEPPPLNAQVLPRDLKEEIEARIAAHTAWLRGRGEVLVAEQFEMLVRHLWARDASPLLPSFRWFCRELDRRRNENTSATLPELSAVLSGAAYRDF